MFETINLHADRGKYWLIALTGFALSGVRGVALALELIPQNGWISRSLAVASILVFLAYLGIRFVMWRQGRSVNRK